MNKTFIILLTLLFSILSCKVSEKIAKNLSCDGNIKVQYDKAKFFGNNNPKTDRKLDAFQVIFLSDFDENINAYVNDKLVFDEYLKIRPLQSKEVII